MHKAFWPTLPFYIPYSQGMPYWWDSFWWAFQLVTMAFLLYLLRTVAVRTDRDFDGEYYSASHSGRRPPGRQDDGA